MKKNLILVLCLFLYFFNLLKDFEIEEKKNYHANDKNSYLEELNIKMIKVENGTFLMGNETGFKDEKPIHKVKINTFYISQFEITQKIWKEVMGYNPSFFKGDSLPIESVSWDDIQKFLFKLNEKKKKNFRLPTEAEWQFAARGGNKSQNYKYLGTSDSTQLYRYVNFCDKNCKNLWAYKEQNDGYENTAPVGSFLPNELGLYDMVGNVWEFVEDKWHRNYNGAPTDGSAWVKSVNSSRVCCGGSYDFYAAYSYPSARYFSEQNKVHNDIGFRIALSDF